MIVEGQTEETFVRDTLRPFLAESGVYVNVRRVQTGRDKHNKHVIYRGGLSNYQKLHDDLLRWIKEDSNAWFSTMIDLYALPDNFPMFEQYRTISDPYEKIEKLETSFADNIDFPRFIPYIQLHEFETLILCNPLKLDEYFMEAERAVRNLQKLCDQYVSPELINEGFETAPSKRIICEIPEYANAKATAGPLVAAIIGLPLMLERCPHFA